MNTKRITTPGSARGISRHAIKVAAYSREYTAISHAVHMTIRSFRPGENPRRQLEPAFDELKEKLSLPHDPKETNERIATIDLVYTIVYLIVEFNHAGAAPPVFAVQEIPA